MILGQRIFFLIFLVLVLLGSVCSGVPVAAKTIAIVYDDSGSMDSYRHLPAFAATTLMATIDSKDKDTRLLFMPFRAFYGAALELTGEPNSLVDYDNVDQGTKIRARSANGQLRFTPQTTKNYYDQISRPPFIEINLSTSLRQSIVDNWSKNLSTTFLDTPFGSIAMMLEALGRETDPGEEVHLIIITDGRFLGQQSGSIPLSFFRNWAERIPADVVSYYVQIVPPENHPDPAIADYNRVQRDEIIEAVNREGIRRGLLETFPSVAGFETNFTVDTGDKVWTALKDIISAIARTDRTAQEDFISSAGNRVTFKTPFSVTRVIAVGSDKAGKAPRPDGDNNSFGIIGSVVTSKMEDTDEGYPDSLQYNAVTTQYHFSPALPANEHWIAFDKSPGSDVFLLFDTTVSLEAVLLDRESGVEIPLVQGRFEVDINQPYLLSLRLKDPNSATSTEFRSLPAGTAFSGRVLGGEEISFTIRPDLNDAVGEVTFSDLGTYSVEGGARFPGFVAPDPVRLDVRALSREVAITLGSEDAIETCIACDDGQIQMTLSREDDPVDVATFTFEIAGLQPTVVEVQSLAKPDFLQLQTLEGAPIGPGSTFDFPTGTGQIAVLLKRIDLPDAAQTDEGDQGPEEFALTLVPRAPSRGFPEVLERSIKILTPSANLVLVSHDTAAPTEGPLAVTGSELRRGETGSTFALRDVLAENITEANFTAQIEGPWKTLLDVSLEYKAATETAHVTASTNQWCLCWIEIYNFLVKDERLVSVTYADGAGRQSAEAVLRLAPKPLDKEWAVSCLIILIAILLIIYLVTMLLMMARSRTFPKNSHVIRRRIGSSQKQRTRLRRFDARYILRLLAAPFTRRVAHQRALVHGIWLEPSAGGALIQMQREPKKSWTLDSGDTLGDILKERPNTTEQYWSYGADLYDTRDTGLRMSLSNEG